MSNLIFTQNRAPDRAPRFLGALAAFLAGLMGVVKRRRKAWGSGAHPDSFNDHMLADIGLRRVRLAPRADDLPPYLGGDRVRISRF